MKFKDYHVLVVEDRKGIANSLERQLKSEGFKVLVCANSDDALIALDNNFFHFIVMDLSLPPNENINEYAAGYSLLRVAREKFEDAYLIAHSAYLYSTMVASDKIVELADKAIRKSVGSTELVCETILQKIYNDSKKEKRMGNYIIRELIYNMENGILKNPNTGEEVIFSANQRALLRMLIENRGQVVSYDQLYAAYNVRLDYEAESFGVAEENVKKMMHKIRAAFKKTGGLCADKNYYIITIPELGYMIRKEDGKV